MKISMLEELLSLDKDFFLYLNNLGSPSWDGFWLFITKTLSSLPLYVILLILSYKQLGIRKTLLLIITVTLLITCTDQLANFFKNGLQRLRPCYQEDLLSSMRLVKGSCGGKFGFYSAHASNSFALGFFFTLLFNDRFRYSWFFLLSWAIIVAYSRIYLGVHFPLDVLSGAAIGMLFSWVFYKLYIFALNKFQV